MEKRSKADLHASLDRMIDTYQGLPPEALASNVNHHDILALLIVFREIIQSLDSSDCDAV